MSGANDSWVDKETPSGMASGGGASSALGSSHFQSFGQFSEFLRGAVADEESLQMGENLQALAVQVEAAMALLGDRDADATQAANALMRVADALRAHRAMLLALGDDWHRFYEFDAHFVALNQFRVLVTAWAKEAAGAPCKLPAPSAFDVAAWRLLGAGAMLLDVYEQSQLNAKQAERAAEMTSNPAASGLRPQPWWRRLWQWCGGRSESVDERRQSTRRGRRRSDL